MLPGAFFGEPERHGEVRVRDERREIVLAAGGEDAAIVIEFGIGELAFLGSTTRWKTGRC